jgi:hypothetical protein
MLRTKLAVFGAVALFGCIGALAQNPIVEFTCETGDGYVDSWYVTPQLNGQGEYVYSGRYVDPLGAWTLDVQELKVKPDPFISAVYGLTNNQGITQSYNLNVTLLIAPPVVPTSLMGGSMGGSVTDANFNGVATVSPLLGFPLYAGQIDLVDVLPLLPAPFAISAPFAGGTANIPATSAGLPGPTLPGPAATTSIGITNRFSLTAGDIAGLTNFFVVVPEPTAALLLATGAIALIRRR